MSKTPRGFTIVELLIVIVVIAILAAIGIVAYGGVQERAHDSAVQGDLRNLAQVLEIYRINYGHYPDTGAAIQALEGFRATHSAYDTDRNLNLSYCAQPSTGTGTYYAVGGISRSGNRFYINSENTTPRPYTSTVDGNQSASVVNCNGLRDSDGIELRRYRAGFNSSANPQWNDWTRAGEAAN